MVNDDEGDDATNEVVDGVEDDADDQWVDLHVTELPIAPDDEAHDLPLMNRLIVPLSSLAESNLTIAGSNEDIADATSVNLELLEDAIAAITKAAKQAETAGNQIDRYTNQLRWLTVAITVMTLVLLVIAIIDLANGG